MDFLIAVVITCSPSRKYEELSEVQQDVTHSDHPMCATHSSEMTYWIARGAAPVTWVHAVQTLAPFSFEWAGGIRGSQVQDDIRRKW